MRIAAEKLADWLVKYSQRPGFKRKIDHAEIDISYFVKDPVSFCSKIINLIYESHALKQLSCEKDYENLKIVYKSGNTLEVLNANGELIVEIILNDPLNLIACERVSKDRIKAVLKIGTLDVKIGSIEHNYNFYKTRLVNESSLRNFNKFLNHLSFFNEEFGFSNNTFFLLKEISIWDETVNENTEILDFINFGNDIENNFKYNLDSNSLDYMFNALKGNLVHSKINTVDDLKSFLSQYETAKNTFKPLCEMIYLELQFFHDFYSVSIIFKTEAGFFCVDFPYDKNFSIDNMRPLPIKKALSIKGNNKTDYTVEDLLVGGKDLWNYIKLLDY